MRPFAVLLALTVTSAASLALADQCQLVSPDVADRAVASIRAARGRVLSYCAPCGDALPPISAASVPRQVRSSGDSVHIDGREVDLAYVYLEVSPGFFENVALRTGCPASDVPEALRFVGGTPRPERLGPVPPSLAPLGWGRPASAPRPGPLPPG